jgi:hypothetical protein
MLLEYPAVTLPAPPEPSTAILVVSGLLWLADAGIHAVVGFVWVRGHRVAAAQWLLLAGCIGLFRSLIVDLPFTKGSALVEIAAAIAYLFKSRPPRRRRRVRRFQFA